MGLNVEDLGLEQVIAPVDINGAGATSFWVSLSRHGLATFLIQKGAWAGGTPAVTLQQATDVAGTGAKALAFDTYYLKGATQAASEFAEVAVVSNTFNLADQANEYVAIEVRGTTLDNNNEFSAVQVVIGTPGANADLLSASVVGSAVSEKGFPHDDMKVDLI